MKIPEKLKGIFFFIVNPRDLTITFSNIMQRGKKKESCTNYENFDFTQKVKSKLAPKFKSVRCAPCVQKFYYFNTEEMAVEFLHKLLST